MSDLPFGNLHAANEPGHELPVGGFVETQARRVNRNLLILTGCLFVLLLLATAVAGPVVYLALRGPRPVRDAELLELADPPLRAVVLDYAVLKKGALIRTGIVERTLWKHSVNDNAEYYVAPVGEKLMLVRVPIGSKQVLVRGPIYRIGSQSKIDLEARDELIKEYPNLEDRLLPFILDGSAQYLENGIILLGVGGTLYVVCLGLFVRGILIWLDPSRHWMLRKLTQFGQPLMIAEEIERDLAVGPLLHLGSAVLTPAWFLQPTTFGAVLVRLSDVVWIFSDKKRSKSTVAIKLRNGTTVQASLKLGDDDLLITELTR